MHDPVAVSTASECLANATVMDEKSHTGVRRLQQAPVMLAVIIVTYGPSLTVLQRLVERVRERADWIIVVDNGSPAEVVRWLSAHIPLAIRLPDNRGLATAQNLGVERARALGASHVIFFDQDSSPEASMLNILVATWKQLQAHGEQVAVVAPQVIDRRRKESLPLFRIERWRLRRIRCSDRIGILPIHTAIASGSLIPLTALDVVGPFRDALFIDLVDIDWCLRAHRLGFRAFAACDAVLSHHLGDRPRRIAGRDITIHPPERTYYFIRNALWLSLSQPLPMPWKWAIIRQAIRRSLFLILFASPRTHYARYTVRACRDALTGRLGPA